jgi:hypothetical protein
MSAILHACRTCVMDNYSDDEHSHPTWCGREFGERGPGDTVKSVEGGDGTDGMEGCTCPECLIAFDAWAQTQEPARVDWNA